ncbi:MAG TPA: hypothetical protein PK264_04925 [Hyphomicrobiaceae bacterium]|nr:hypothetical protein [Hyphomicrobiaceae bacterium]
MRPTAIAITSALVAVSGAITAAPVLATDFKIDCASLEEHRSPKIGPAAKLTIENERATDIEVKVIRNNGADISLGAVKAKSKREVTTRMRYVFSLHDAKGGKCIQGVRMTSDNITIVVK